MESISKQYALDNKKFAISTTIKSIAIIASVYGIVLGYRGLITFSYFTNLSNIYVDIVLVGSLIFDFMIRSGKVKEKPQMMYLLKFLATLSISLTFLVFMFILAPTQKSGFLNAYLGHYAGSLGVHFINPLLAFIDYCLFDYEFKSGKKHSIYAIIPPLCYVVFVIILAVCGVRWNDVMYAPYNFLNFGAETGWFGFDLSKMSSESLGIGVFYMIVVLSLIFVGIGRLFLFIKDRRKRKMDSQ